jgi:hypothetical protein
MTTQATTQKTGMGVRTRSALLFALALGVILAAMVSLIAGTGSRSDFPGHKRQDRLRLRTYHGHGRE